MTKTHSFIVFCHLISWRIIAKYCKISLLGCVWLSADLRRKKRTDSLLRRNKVLHWNEFLSFKYHSVCPQGVKEEIIYPNPFSDAKIKVLLSLKNVLSTMCTDLWLCTHAARPATVHPGHTCPKAYFSSHTFPPSRNMFRFCVSFYHHQASLQEPRRNHADVTLVRRCVDILCPLRTRQT